jgi:DNA invertase Pin-like site-specific DNA recombinase
VMAEVAELEAGLISQRTKEALAAAKTRGVKLGCRHTKISEQAQQGGIASGAVRGQKAQQRAKDLRPVIEKIRRQGARSLRAVAEELNAREIHAPRGGSWHPASVARILA